ncbi:MAG: radical SAM protein [Candidatus Omnitrophica bacterium]|nr:radical SAM protein [Candidatus Omnitrophota bacterium]
MDKPGYLALYLNGELNKRIELLKKNLSKCILCPRNCKVNRMNGELGFCRASSKITIAFYKRHFGEEPPISGEQGSGVIFFSNCTGRCVFCQNFYFSQRKTGFEITEEMLAKLMLRIKRWGCHNINLVTPTQYLPQIISALKMAIENGFDIPLVFNSSGYESLEVLKLLEGIIDIYLPDMKYSNDVIAKELSNFTGYVKANRGTVLEMFRQVGILQLNKKGVARKGLIIRHLILPDDMAGTEKTLKFISKNLSKEVHVSLMDQYFPEHAASKFNRINRTITQEEYQNAIRLFYECGLQNGWIQEHIINNDKA